MYDYIDNHAAMLEKMHNKRLKGYASLGYTVSADRDAALGSEIIYDQNTFQARFLSDVAGAKESVVIVSPFISIRRARWIGGALSQCVQKRVRVTVVTRDAATLPAKSRGTAPSRPARPAS